LTDVGPSDSLDPLEPFAVPGALDGERLDRALAMLTGWSRAEVQTLIREGSVLVGRRTVSKSRRLQAGEVVQVERVPRTAPPPGPEPVAIAVRYADDDLVVVDKPAGLVVHPGAGHDHGTLVHGLLHEYPEIAAVGDPARPGIVHRLDRDTSGLMLVARSPAAYDTLVEDLAQRRVERTYLALVWGVPESTRGVIDAPIGRSTRRRTRMAIREAGREARTAYALVEAFEGSSLLECRLETGRTHQIRVHLDAIGHPVVGDELYGGRREPIPLARPFLLAARLSLSHPTTGRPLELEAPLPPELVEVLEGLRAGGAEPLA
jgi:23S rRNA pseudouridine1911/1915/1917 synthase